MSTRAEELRTRLRYVAGYADDPSLIDDGSGVEQLENAVELVINAIDRNTADGVAHLNKNWVFGRLADVLELHVDDEAELSRVDDESDNVSIGDDEEVES